MTTVFIRRYKKRGRKFVAYRNGWDHKLPNEGGDPENARKYFRGIFWSRGDAIINLQLQGYQCTECLEPLHQ